MTAAPTEVPDVAKKRSESRKFNTLVRFDDDLAAKARKVAALKGISLAEYLVDIVRPIVDRDMTKEIKKLSKEEGEPR
jgi:predicted HicB family RNase H-like nuclease